MPFFFGECGSELCEPSRDAPDDGGGCAEDDAFAGVLAALGLGGSDSHAASRRLGGAGERGCSDNDDDGSQGLRTTFARNFVPASTSSTAPPLPFNPGRKRDKRAPGTVVGAFSLRNPSVQALKHEARGRAKSDVTETELAVRQMHGRVQYALHTAAKAACRPSSLGEHVKNDVLVENDVVDANAVDRLRLLRTK
jgi:hypothetical protein